MRAAQLGGALLFAAAGCSAGSYPDHCTIAGATFSSQATNPQNPCLVCLPQVHSNDWSEVAAGSPCGDGGAICFSENCQNGCLIAPVFYSAGAMNPAAPCESCQPESDSLGWSLFLGFAPGNCPPGQYCGSGGCRSGCFVDGGDLEPDQLDPQNLCQSCQPVLTPGGWTHLGDGTACDAGAVCVQGLCQPACAIGGATYPPGALAPGNPCLSCLPEQTSSAWSPISGPAGAGCDSTEVCNSGACMPGCFIDGGFAAPGTDPADPCRCCDPALSTSSWSAGLDGIVCRGTSFCSAGACLQGCFINGVFYPSGASDPTNACSVCRPDGCNQYDWSDAPSGTLCGRGGICRGAVCDHPPFTCLPAGVACEDGGQPCCTSLDGGPYGALNGGLYGGCGAAGTCACVPFGILIGFYVNCATPAPACCSTVCSVQAGDSDAFCSCFDAGLPCTTDVQCCSGCCADGFCN